MIDRPWVQSIIMAVLCPIIVIALVIMIAGDLITGKSLSI